MIAMPIADIMRYKKAKQNNGDALFDYSGPVVEYVAVEREKPERPMHTFFRISGIMAWVLVLLITLFRIAYKIFLR